MMMTKREARRTLGIERADGRCAEIICDTTPDSQGRPRRTWLVSSEGNLLTLPLRGYRASYRSGDTHVTTQVYATLGGAWWALEQALLRAGIEPGPWHMPGVVAGDCGNTVSRANGSAWIEKIS
jgi:hypothetical protein